MSDIIYTHDELISLLQHSSLPTVLVEGDDDEFIFRALQDRLKVDNIDILPCGGRTNLLALYSRKAEVTNIPLFFIADRDMWMFSNIPGTYVGGISFTSGYSIENDLLAGSNIESYLLAGERPKYKRMIFLLCEWFASIVAGWQAGNTVEFKVHLNQIISRECDQILSSAPQGISPCPELEETIKSNYHLHLRGHHLLEGLVRFLSGKRKSRYSAHNVLDICSHDNTNKYIEKLLRDIELHFCPTSSPSSSTQIPS